MTASPTAQVRGVAPTLREPQQLRDLLRRTLSRKGSAPFELTDEQLRAATAPLEPGVIVAGAGSGKTSVMAARVVWLIGSGAVAPDEVLGLTFTNKAAGELSERVRRTIAAALGVDPEAGEPTILTYHAYAARLLRDHGVLIGVEPQGRLLVDSARYQLAERVLRRTRAALAEVTAHTPTTARALLALDGELNEHLVDVEDLAAADAVILDWVRSAARPTKAVEKIAATARKRLELGRLVVELRQAKQDGDLQDFGDQMAAAARLVMAHPRLGAAERQRFGVVLLDEYQDTSITQKRLLQALFGAGHPVTAVGDPCQAIYGWRGASVRNIDVFDSDFPAADGPARRYSLTVNNRSGERLLDLANRLAGPLRDRHHVEQLLPRHDARGAGWTRCALHVSHAEEMTWLRDQVLAELQAGTPAREIAILVRRRSDFAPCHRVLTDAGVPVEVVGLGGLLALPAVVDVIATLRVLADPTANAALVRLLTGPRWRIGPRDLALLGRRAAHLASGAPAPVDRSPDSAPMAVADLLAEAVAGVDPVDVPSLWDALKSPGRAEYSAAARGRFAALAAELAELQRHASEPLLDLIGRVVDLTGLAVELGATPGGDRTAQGAALDAFIDAAAAFHDLDGDGGLRAFLAYLDAAEEYENGLDAATPTESDSVKLLTVHKAKGLEWEVVLLPSLAATVFPDNKPRESWLGSPAALPFELRGDAADFPDRPALTKDGLDGFRREIGELSAVEELRLAYVAVTRARRLLIASGHWWGPEQVRPRGPSDYLLAIKEHAETGAGDVVCWAEQPADGRNPALGVDRSLRWPVPLDPQRFAARTAAAAAVRAAGDRRAAGAPGPVVPSRHAELVAGWDADLRLLLAEATAADEEPTVTLPEAMAATSLLSVLTDPQRFATDLARPMPRPPAPAALRGTRFHRWVEARFGAVPLLDADDLGGAADQEIDDADLTALQEAFLAGPYADRRPAAVEAPFRLVIAGLVLHGRIDAVYDLGDGRWQVVDWKTGRRPADPRQLALYRLAWAEMTGVRPDDVDAVFYVVASGEVDRPESLPDRAALAELIAAATGPR